MAARYAPVWVIGIVFFAGCSPSYKLASLGPADTHQVEACKVVMESLQNDNLPALESVDSWHSKYGPGLKLTTAHYEIFTTLLEPLMLRQIPGFMESAYRAYNQLLPAPVETTTKLRIFLFADRRQWDDFTKTFAGPRAEIFRRIKAGAYYLNDTCVTYYIGRSRTLSALGHEGWHQFNSRHFEFRLPSWLDEGIAILFEASQYQDGRFYFEPTQNKHRLEALKTTLLSDQQIPLNELVAMNPGEVLATDQAQAVQAFYSQAYALVRFLREASSGKHQDKFRRLLFDGLRGDWLLSPASKKIAADRNIPRTVDWNREVGPQLFKQYINRNISHTEIEYLAFCNQIVRNTPLTAQYTASSLPATGRSTISRAEALLRRAYGSASSLRSE